MEKECVRNVVMKTCPTKQFIFTFGTGTVLWNVDYKNGFIV